MFQTGLKAYEIHLAKQELKGKEYVYLDEANFLSLLLFSPVRASSLVYAPSYSGCYLSLLRINDQEMITNPRYLHSCFYTLLSHSVFLFFLCFFFSSSPSSFLLHNFTPFIEVGGGKQFASSW